jgi:hypothetical protein
MPANAAAGVPFWCCPAFTRTHEFAYEASGMTEMFKKAMHLGSDYKEKLGTATAEAVLPFQGCGCATTAAAKQVQQS